MFGINHLVGFGVGGSAINPDDIASLEYWLRSDSGLSATAWTDQSGNSRDLDTDGGTPSVASADIDGLDALDCSGGSSGDRLYGASTVNLTRPIHAFVLMAPDEFTSGQRFLFASPSSAASSTPLIVGDGTGVVVRATDGGGAKDARPSGGPSVGNYGLFHCVWGADSDVVKAAWNRGAYASTAVATVSTEWTGLCLGASADGQDDVDCRIAEVAIYTGEVSGADLTGLLDYFAQRYPSANW